MGLTASANVCCLKPRFCIALSKGPLPPRDDGDFASTSCRPPRRPEYAQAGCTLHGDGIDDLDLVGRADLDAPFADAVA
ncbi:hypothetical protein ABZX98_25695 [Streptomyces sp. NPDC002992]|uniref:hypothetical protein n=1 Tax=Streptomyces sp. NPDC002992 TaxID=3154273 RepID=UPI0033A867DB